jgi:hypothetical protein
MLWSVVPVKPVLLLDVMHLSQVWLDSFFQCVSGKTSSAASGSTREPTRSPKTSTWMFCC